MRILLLTPMPPRPEAPGAIPLVFDALVTGLRERHSLTLITVVGDEPGEAEAADAARRSGLDVHVVDRRRPSGLARQQRRLRLAARWARGQWPWRTVWFADPAIQQTIDALTKGQTFDVVAVEDNSMGVFRLPAHLPAVLTEHEVQRLEADRRRNSHWWARLTLQGEDRRRWPRYQPAVWRRFDRVQVFTSRDASRVFTLAPDVRERVRVNPFGVNLPRRRADAFREVPNSLLFAGNFTHPPNVDAAIWLAREVMPRLRVRQPSAKLTIVGRSAPQEVRALAGEGIEFMGEVAAILPLLESAAVVLAPVRSGGGMRMKVLHALAAGKAVVTTKRGAEGLLLEDAKPPLVIADDAETIAIATSRLLDDSVARRELGEQARAFVLRRHSPQAYAARLEEVYKEAVASRAPRAGSADG
jgi:glycosyltransferase involved in cell wall biosynthesis